MIYKALYYLLCEDSPTQKPQTTYQSMNFTAWEILTKDYVYTY